jgi:hypothetical protein
VVWRDDFPPEIADVMGICRFPTHQIVLNWPLLLLKKRTDTTEPFHTLIHEFVHLRYLLLNHGQEFRRLLLLTYGRMVGDPWMEKLFQRRAEERRR